MYGKCTRGSRKELFYTANTHEAICHAKEACDLQCWCEPKVQANSSMSKVICGNFEAICALTTIARFAYPAWETIVIPVGNVIICKQGRTHYNHNLKEEEEENEEE